MPIESDNNKKEENKIYSNAFMLYNDLANGIISNSVEGAKPVETYKDFKTYLLQLKNAFLAKETQKDIMIKLDDGTSYPLVGYKGYIDENGKPRQFASNQELYTAYNAIYSCMESVLKTISVKREDVEKYRKLYKNAFNRESGYFPGETKLIVDYPSDATDFVYTNFYNMENIIKLLDEFADKEKANEVIKQSYNNFKKREESKRKNELKDSEEVLDEQKGIQYRQKKADLKKQEQLKKQPKPKTKMQILRENRKVVTKLFNINEEERGKLFKKKWFAKRISPLLETKYEKMNSASELSRYEFKDVNKNRSLNEVRHEKMFGVNEIDQQIYDDFKQDPRNNLNYTEDELKAFHLETIKENVKEYANKNNIVESSSIYNYIMGKTCFALEHFENDEEKENELDYLDETEKLMFNELKEEARINAYKMLVEQNKKIAKDFIEEQEENDKNKEEVDVQSVLPSWKTREELKNEYYAWRKEILKEKDEINKRLDEIKEPIPNIVRPIEPIKPDPPEEPNYDSYTEPSSKEIFFSLAKTNETSYEGVYNYINNRFTALKDGKIEKEPLKNIGSLLDTYSLALKKHNERPFFDRFFSYKKYHKESKQLEEMRKYILTNKEIQPYLNGKSIKNMAKVLKTVATMQQKISYIQSIEKYQRDLIKHFKETQKYSEEMKEYNNKLDEYGKAFGEYKRNLRRAKKEIEPLLAQVDKKITMTSEEYIDNYYKKINDALEEYGLSNERELLAKEIFESRKNEINKLMDEISLVSKEQHEEHIQELIVDREKQLKGKLSKAYSIKERQLEKIKDDNIKKGRSVLDEVIENNEEELEDEIVKDKPKGDNVFNENEIFIEDEVEDIGDLEIKDDVYLEYSSSFIGDDNETTKEREAIEILDENVVIDFDSYKNIKEEKSQEIINNKENAQEKTERKEKKLSSDVSVMTINMDDESVEQNLEKRRARALNQTVMIDETGNKKEKKKADGKNNVEFIGEFEEKSIDAEDEFLKELGLNKEELDKEESLEENVTEKVSQQ